MRGSRLMVALDAATARHLWSLPTDDNVWSSPAVLNGVVYIDSKDGYVYAITEG